MKQVTASAPGKLLLFGDHAVVYGHPCIVTAIDQRVHVTLELQSDDFFEVASPTYRRKVSLVGKEKVAQELQFVVAVFEEFFKQYPQKKGVRVSTKSDFSSMFGFGSSSAVSVAFAKALAEIYAVELSNENLFKLIYQSILKVQKVGSGFDVAAAIWGGTLYYISPAKVVTPLLIDRMPLSVGYTGVKVKTAKVIQEVAAAKSREPERIERLFQRSNDIVEQAKVALEQAAWLKVGHLMNQNQLVLAELGVSSPLLYKLIAAAKKGGAFGAKLSGAGKGDCMIAVSDIKKTPSVEEAMTAVGGQVLSVQTGAEGVRIEI